MRAEAYFIGIDLGSQGMRVAVLDNRGRVVAAAGEELALTEASRQEQDPEIWWQFCVGCLKKIVQNLSEQAKKNLVSLSVSSTSGTVIALDHNNMPLSKAIMYSDNRSIKQAEHCKLTARAAMTEGFTGFNSSCGLPKMIWFIQNFPQKAREINQWIHAADFITGKLTGVYNVTDYTNALKSGYDLSAFCWPDYLITSLKLRTEWLQKVVPSGTVVGKIDKEVATKIGLPDHLLVSVGITDGCASQVASGAMQPGQWNTTLGTTMVIKGVTKQQVKDPEGRIYNHRHPEGYWLPGGAGNIGADWVAKEYPTSFSELSGLAKSLIPTGEMAYPLMQEGERFPFLAPRARGFCPKQISHAQLFAAKMEGVAYVERYAYALMEGLSGEKAEVVFTAGGASTNELWLKIRSAVLNKPIYKMKYVSGAVGAAIVAASQTYFSSLSTATQKLVQEEKEILPQQTLVEKYEPLYHQFIANLKSKNYLEDNKYA